MQMDGKFIDFIFAESSCSLLMLNYLVEQGAFQFNSNQDVSLCPIQHAIVFAW